jgi:hypothetical protein
MSFAKKVPEKVVCVCQCAAHWEPVFAHYRYYPPKKQFVWDGSTPAVPTDAHRIEVVVETYLDDSSRTHQVWVPVNELKGGQHV